MTKPNIVVVYVDDQPPHIIDEAQSYPFLNTLSLVKFPNAVLSTSLCGPSRAGLLSGQRWDHHRVRGNQDCQNLDERRTLAVWLNAAGYTTALAGKYINGYPFRTPYVPAGWSRWFATTEGDVSYDTWNLVDENLTEYPAPSPRTGNDAQDYVIDVEAAYCANLVATAPQPFFLYFAVNGPHGGSQPPTRYTSTAMTIVDDPDFNQADVSHYPAYISSRPSLTSSEQTDARNDLRLTRRTCRAIDDAIAAIYAALTARGIANNTIIVFAADNGNARGNKRIPIAENTLQKRAPYWYAVDASLRVVWPGVAARTDPALVSNIDLTATLAAVGGATVPDGQLDGRDLTSLITNGGSWVDAIEFTCHGNNETNIPPFWACRTAQWKYAEWLDAPGESVGTINLFDLTADPYEMVDLANDGVHTATQATMAALLNRLKNDPHAHDLGKQALPASFARHARGNRS